MQLCIPFTMTASIDWIDKTSEKVEFSGATCGVEEDFYCNNEGIY